MKLIIDIPELFYNNSKKRVSSGIDLPIDKYVANGTPYEERPQGEFTDLERQVIADSINYLLGAELLEENGYTEEVIAALKSVLSKIGAE